MDLSDISIRARLLASNIIICSILIVFNIVVYKSISTMETTSHWVDHTEEVISLTNGLVNSMVNQETGIRGYAITGENEYLEPYLSGKEDFQTFFNAAKLLTSDNPSQQVRYDDVAKQSKLWGEYAESIISLRKNIRSGEQINTQLKELINSGIGKQQMDNIRLELNKLGSSNLNITVLNAMVNMETGLRGFLLNRQETYLEPYQTGKNVIDQQNSNIKETRLAESIDSWINDYALQAITLTRQSTQFKSMSDLYAVLDKKQGKVYMDELRSKVTGIIDVELSLMEQRKAESASAATMATRVIIWGCIIVILLVFVFSHITSVSIINPIQQAVAYAKQLAAGNLNINVGQQGKSESGVLLLAIQTVSNNLKDMIGHIAQTSSKLNDASTYLNSVLDKTGSGAKDQLDKTEQITDAMQQLSLAVQEVSQNTVNASHVATKAVDEAEAGYGVIQNTIGHIGDLNDEIKRTSLKITSLAEETNNIGKILDVIGGVAEQTNLLALNAAIEAARAGEQGRGFAVVADEVRVLAQRTQESTTEIHSLIESIQSGTKDVVNSMQQSTGLLTASIDSASHSGGTFSEITRSITKINDMNTQSASATEQQSVATEQVNTSMLAVNSISQENYTLMMDSVRSCEDLTNLSNSLNATVKQFKM